MSQFYLTLPSNSSMDYYPDNTVARYTTKLTNTVELEGEWEVGLTEISFPSEVENVIGGHCYYKRRKDRNGGGGRRARRASAKRIGQETRSGWYKTDGTEHERSVWIGCPWEKTCKETT